MRCRIADTWTPLRVISSPSRKMRPAWIGSSRLTQRRSVPLSAPARSDDDEHLAEIDAEVDAVQHEVVAEALANRLETDHRRAVRLARFDGCRRDAHCPVG